MPGDTTRRGYGTAHQRARRNALAAFQPGDPCTRCGLPMWKRTGLELDHTDDRTGYLGLAHATCNRRAGADKANGRVRHVQDREQPTPHGFWSDGGWNMTSRDW